VAQSFNASETFKKSRSAPRADAWKVFHLALQRDTASVRLMECHRKTMGLIADTLEKLEPLVTACQTERGVRPHAVQDLLPFRQANDGNALERGMSRKGAPDGSNLHFSPIDQHQVRAGQLA
jgi:hypothetical protein